VMEKVNGLDLGANDYITKPFHIESCLRAFVWYCAQRNVVSDIIAGHTHVGRSIAECILPSGYARRRSDRADKDAV
jgi:DNA-binding response OmpR family regulator